MTLLKDVSVRWWFTSTRRGTVKMMHGRECQYARQPYDWANQHRTTTELLDALGPAVAWHDACARCSPALKALLADARLRLMTERANTQEGT